MIDLLRNMFFNLLKNLDFCFGFYQFPKIFSLEKFYYPFNKIGKCFGSGINHIFPG